MISILATSRSGHHWVGSVVQSWFTDEKVNYLTNVLPKDLKNHGLGDKRVIVIRSYKNFLASMLKTYLDANGIDSPWKEAVKNKTEAYYAIIGEAVNPQYFNAHTTIDYDRFVVSRAYRMNKCRELGGTYTEDELGVVSEEGSGFDGHSYNDIIEGVNNRHEQILETPYKDIYEELIKEQYS